ncbi:peroxide stress protein YaaA [Streptomyces sp. NPDC059506]|uniref:peroxide stress protein YaaA n=1 Tax=unclassified Streptomyces TaxID=2593676 RepID=UPI0015F97161|nr:MULTISPECIES: peroxide stress protein YaaA [unclassified Streptomyces]MCZ2525185.1 peroxide stress protein YaaA [Streptomyces sp. HB2AG]
MLVLLPPSEGKASGGAGPALSPGLEGLSLPGLNEARSTVLEELVGLCSGDGDKAREVLGLSEGLRGEVAKNAGLRGAPTVPAGRLYTGVLYDALGLGSLDGAAAERAARSLLVFSGLWGALRVTDEVPSYRCPMGVKLPGTGALGAFWRGPMDSVMPEAAGSGLVLDLRSAAYAAAWKPGGEVAGRTAAVRVLQVKVVDGVEKRSVVSHFNKATKGRLTRDLLVSGAEPAGPQELVETLEGLGYRVEASAPQRAGRPWQVDVLVTDVH